MAYDEEQHKKSRVVIETPTARREVVQTSTARAPERRGISTGVVAALVIGSIALVTILFLYILNRQNNDTTANTNLRTTTTTTQTPLPQQPVIVQQATPLPQQPIIIQQPAQAASQPPVIIEQPAPAPASSGTTTIKPSGPDDTTIQSEIDKRISQDATLSTVAVTATVNGGKVTLIGTVDTPAIKNQYEKLVRAVKGVKSVDDQIVVSGG
ncbi:MAG: hypothetical protein QOC96_883 [Acidobacteriota bacterium]|jgi:hypothetical protein|nr:hypothetical protein [Acidobacteriota bacterium]